MSKVLLCYEDFSELMTTQTVLKKVGFDVMPISSEFGLTQQVLQFNPDIVVGYGKGPKVSTIGVGRRLKEMPRWTGSVVLVFAPGMKPAPSDLARIRMDMALEAPLEVTRLIQVLANFTNQDPHALIERMMKSAAQEMASLQSKAAAKDDSVFVTGSAGGHDAWNVQGGQEIDEFNRLMGLPPNSAAGPHDLNGRPITDFEPAAAPPGNPDDVDQKAVQAQLARANEAVHEKVKGYEKFLQEPISTSQSTLPRTETRKAQKELLKDWPDEELKGQDQLRRAFTRAMFKKKD